METEEAHMIFRRDLLRAGRKYHEYSLLFEKAISITANRPNSESGVRQRQVPCKVSPVFTAGT